MRVFVSSSFLDLSEHRAAAIRVLRQLGHEVVAMEDMVAGTSAPLTRVLELVERCEAYVGIFAWRYGYVPDRQLPAGDRPPDVAGATYGTTSITHYEYLRAKELGLPILAFLLDEDVPVTPRFIDGFDPDPTGQATDTALIRDLREQLQFEKVVSWFTTPSDLEARVAAAITSVGLGRQIDIQPAVTIGGRAGDDDILDSAGYGIAAAVAQAERARGAIRINLASPWWSTRLFLVAALLESLSATRRIVIVDRRGAPGPADDDDDDATGAIDDDARTPVAFVGLLSTGTVIRVLEPTAPQLGRFRAWLRSQPSSTEDPAVLARRYLHEGWVKALVPRRSSKTSTSDSAREREQAIKVDVSPGQLRRWFGDSMIEQPVEIRDLGRASVVDLVRLIDYPNEFVPVLTGRVPDADAPGAAGPVGVIDVVDKVALTTRLAHTYLAELKERERIA